MSMTASTLNTHFEGRAPRGAALPRFDTRAICANTQSVVLAVDDHPDSLALVGDILGTEGYTVMCALDGATAMDRVRLITPDIILLDACMPGMDGFDLCRKLKLQSSLAAVPIVFMTGLTDSEDLVRGFRAGGDDYVTKPVKPDEIRVRVEAHLRRSMAQRQANAAVDAGGRGVAIVQPDGALRWCSERGRELLQKHVDGIATGGLPGSVVRWLNSEELTQHAFDISRRESRLTIRWAGLAAQRGIILTLTEQDDDKLRQEFMTNFELTLRQAEVLLWVARGKTNRDISEILGMKPRTVNKHLEHVFPKLGVETRAAAANVSLHVSG